MEHIFGEGVDLSLDVLADIFGGSRTSSSDTSSSQGEDSQSNEQNIDWDRIDWEKLINDWGEDWWEKIDQISFEDYYEDVADAVDEERDEDYSNKDIALGHGEVPGRNVPSPYLVTYFASNISGATGRDVYAYPSWYIEGLTDRDVSGLNPQWRSIWEEEFQKATTRAEHIHFNLEGTYSPDRRC